MKTLSSEPNLTKFNPKVIPYQYKVIKDIRRNFNYSQGTHEILLSGSVGSAKSILMAHIIVTHCMMYPRARVLMGRKALPDLKSTIFQKILEHISEDLEEGYDYFVNTTTAHIRFRNGSEIISRSWSDKKYKKMRSLEISAACIEELTENNLEDKSAYDEIKMRVGRLNNVPEKFIICASNPDSPAHWAYKYFIESQSKTRHVYYSVTFDNPFLPPEYIEQLRTDLDPKLARRMIYGEWIEITQDVIYYAYKRDKNFRSYSWQVQPGFPIHISWDFNIGVGKPLSVVLFQFINGTFHIFGEVVIDGASTLHSCEELAAKGFLDFQTIYYIHGDATGAARTTKAIHSDYDVIYGFLDNYASKNGRIKYVKQVPRSNPPIRLRHNIVNSYCENVKKEHRLIVYKDAPTADEGLRLTAFKKGADLVEDDSFRGQHITTAIGYGVVYCHQSMSMKQYQPIGR